MNLINHSTRSIGVMGAYKSYVLAPNESAPVTDADIKKIKDNKTCAHWLKTGLIALEHTATVTEKSTVKHVGRGRYSVFAEGVQLNDEPLSKEQAEAMKVEYDGVNS